MPKQKKPSDLKRSIGQLLIIGFDGTEMSPSLAALLTRIQPAGVILFARNITSVSPKKLRASPRSASSRT